MLNIARDPAIAADTRKMMDRQLSHMVRLIDDLLDASRITNDKLTLRKEWVSLRAVAETAVEASRPVIDAAGHTLRLALPEEPVWLDADPTRLAQVVSNLLTNAAKYTPEGGCIELAAVRERRRSHCPRHGHRARHPARDAGRGVRDVHPGRTARSSALREGLALAWPWSSGWSSCTAVRLPPRAPDSAREAPSPFGSRSSRPRRRRNGAANES